MYGTAEAVGEDTVPLLNDEGVLVVPTAPTALLLVLLGAAVLEGEYG